MNLAFPFQAPKNIVVPVLKRADSLMPLLIALNLIFSTFLEIRIFSGRDLHYHYLLRVLYDP
jgi:hypothetical protein